MATAEAIVNRMARQQDRMVSGIKDEGLVDFQASMYRDEAGQRFRSCMASRGYRHVRIRGLGAEVQVQCIHVDGERVKIAGK